MKNDKQYCKNVNCRVVIKIEGKIFSDEELMKKYNMNYNQIRAMIKKRQTPDGTIIRRITLQKG